jgi:hypothetical protein
MVVVVSQSDGSDGGGDSDGARKVRIEKRDGNE